jgi:hypothetical protein
MSPLESTSPQLNKQYFRYPEIWRFNSPDFYLFYYIIAGIIAVFSLFFLLIVLATNRGPQPVQQIQSKPVPSVSVSIQTPQSKASQSTQKLQSTTPVISHAQELLSAEQQPSYALRAESYAKLKENPALSATERQKASAAYTKYNRLNKRAEAKLKTAREQASKQYYSASIRSFENLIAQGEILGNVYLKAKEDVQTTRIKKIDYHLIQGELSKASLALAEAKKAGIADSLLTEYETRIKNLFKANQ